MSDDVERGAAEDNSDTPVTPTEVEASRTPPSVGGGHPDSDSPEDEAGSEPDGAR